MLHTFLFNVAQPAFNNNNNNTHCVIIRVKIGPAVGSLFHVPDAPIR